MGFSTIFWGRIDIEPALPKTTRQRLLDWVSQDHRDGSTPSIWCDWVPTPDGMALVWNGAEKFYEAADWMRFLIEKFIAKGHTANGSIFALAEPEMGVFEAWCMRVKHNVVRVDNYEIPPLDFDDESESLFEQLDISIPDALDKYAVAPSDGVRAIEDQLRMVRDQLKHPEVASALARFIAETASVLPQPEKLRVAVARFF